jgi:hypothetical protein
MNLDKVDEKSENTSLHDWYRTNKYGDWLLDHIPYGWRMYYKYYDIKRWFIDTYQRMRYGVTDSECWSLTDTFTKFILPRLKHFKKVNVNSHPIDVTPEEWSEILDEIIWTFEYMNDPDKFNPFPPIEFDDGDINKFFKNINREKTPEQKQSWDNYVKKSEELEKRRKKGMLLFAEYYSQLWD